MDRDDVAAAAMHIADGEGIGALTMRRLAAELGVRPMTLYHYVRNKDEVLVLLVDRFLGEALVPEQALNRPWREALTAVALGLRDALLRHPWVLDITDDPLFGPNGLKHFDQGLGALAGMHATIETKVEILTSVEELVYGHFVQEKISPYGTPDEIIDQLSARIEELISGGDYPSLAALAEDGGFSDTWRRIEAKMTEPDRFDRALSRLLDGIEEDLRAAAPQD
jgi:AcrR family transcriptional regulator